MPTSEPTPPSGWLRVSIKNREITYWAYFHINPLVFSLEKSGHHIRNITELYPCANPHAFLLIRLYFRHFWNGRFQANFRHHTSALQSGLSPHINLVNSGRLLAYWSPGPFVKTGKTYVFWGYFFIRAKRVWNPEEKQSVIQEVPEISSSSKASGDQPGWSKM